MNRKQSVVLFRAEVWDYYYTHGRHDLAWRHTKDPYAILVSEIMLQQTQVSRVIEKYNEFLHEFPTLETLARATLAKVLSVWSGMGYNRRAKYLKQMAEMIMQKYGGKIPQDFATLCTLPGVGTYTASAVRVFAHNEPDVLLETNVRAVYIHHFFCNTSDLPHDKKTTRKIVKSDFTISDTEILAIARGAAEGQDPREWHWALMDYGSHLKKLHPNPSRKSATYTKQSKFEGSVRQVRGEILRILKKDPQTEANIYSLIRANKQIVRDEKSIETKRRLKDALVGLEREGMIVKRKGGWGIA